jgi:hypothetical protein
MFIQYVEGNGWSDETNEKRIKVRDGIEFNEPYPVRNTLAETLLLWSHAQSMCRVDKLRLNAML